jgi:hypothetical protein
MVVEEGPVVMPVQKWLLEILTVVVEVEPETRTLEELEDLKEMMVVMLQDVHLLVQLAVVVLVVLEMILHVTQQAKLV